ncbi:MAG TPA: YbaK/EbsC family protein [Patescibacteria group bacterium]|nr:YbaK/EbsC family protein [Patescibacteria group bacterium]
MRYSKIYIPTVKDGLPGSEALNYRLLHKAGYIRKNAVGHYSFLPLGSMLVHKLKGIFENKLSDLGCFEVHLPELVSMEDFYQQIAVGNLSYKELPVGGWRVKACAAEKVRPRLGLLQSKSWISIEGFKLLEDMEALKLEHQNAAKAFEDILNSLKVDFIKADQLSWACRGEFDKILLLPYANGEDIIASCKRCNRLTARDSMKCIPAERHKVIEKELKMKHTPGAKTITEVAQYLKEDASSIVKTLIYKADEKLYGILIKGDRGLSEVKLKNILNCYNLRPADEKEVFEATGAEVGFAGPIGLKAEIVCDYEVAAMKGLIIGANKTDYHYLNAVIDRDFKADIITDIRSCTIEDKCPECGGDIEFIKGFVLGKIRKHGSFANELQELQFINKQGSLDNIYIIDFEYNLNRIIAAVAEKNSDSAGLKMPNGLAPFDIVVMAVHSDNEAQTHAAIQIYNALKALKYNVLLDDRTDRVSVKYIDAELIGIPLRITVGRKINEDIVELKYRDGDMQEVRINDILEVLLDHEVEHAEEIS